MKRRVTLWFADVLVIGGGIGALVAANKAVDEGAKVIVVDKSTVGFSGQMPLSGGNFVCCPPDRVDDQTRWYVEAGDYVNDQEYTEAFVQAMYPVAQEVATWGIFSFDKDYDGNVMFTRGGGRIHTSNTHLVLPAMTARIKKAGATVLNKIYIAELIKKDGAVAGAVGFHYRTGEFHVFQAKSTILACGGCMYKSRAKFHINNGEGIAMAYDAGAEMRNSEFGNLFHHTNKYTRDDVGAMSGLIASSKNLLVNAHGEDVHAKHAELNKPWPTKPQWMVLPPHMMTNAWIEEIEAGNGPIYLDLTTVPDIYDPAVGGAHHGWGHDTYGYRMSKLGMNIVKEKVEWDLSPEFHQGPVRVDTASRTTVPGLYAVGDLTTQGSSCFGAIPCYPGGNPLSYAMISAYWAGSDAGKAVRSASMPDISLDEIEKQLQRINKPLETEEGYNPYKAIEDIQTVLFKVKNSYYKDETRLNKALEQIQTIEERLPELSAKDSHELVRCHEAEAMVCSAKILYHASLLRKETRGSHLRQDYKERNDADWLKWITLYKAADGTMAFRYDPIPMKDYKYKPDGLTTDGE